MKRAAIFFVVIFAMGILFSACNKEACPAYSQHDTEEYENLG